MYHDTDGTLWKIDKGWEDLSPNEWVEVCFYALRLGCILYIFSFIV